MQNPAVPDAAAGASAGARRVRFGRFELLPIEGRLLVDGEPAALGGRAFDVLQLLVERAGSLVKRNDLIERAWPDVVVEENNLSVQINSLRRVLGAEVIVTVPGRGYRLGVPVEPVVESASPQRAPGPPSPGVAAQAPVPAAAPQPRLRSHLPIGLPALFGRDEDLATLGSLVDTHRLVTLVGAGGVGKTRLAQALLQERAAGNPQGVCWVDLNAAVDAEALPGVVGTALGLLRAPGEPLASLVRAAAGLDTLVALDNAETQLDAVAALVQALLDGVPGLRLLVTSQAPLRVAGERVLRLGPLSVPDPDVSAAQARHFGAIALFADRAQAADSRFTLHDGQLARVAELCRRLDGLPLALELAAARVPVMGLAVLLDSLGDRLQWLTANRNRNAPPRQQTLRDTLQWSYGLLGPLEKALMRQLAVPSGSVSLAYVQAVMAPSPPAGDPWAVLDALDQLVQRSLVDAVVQDSWTAPRYRLLESPRALALELLVEAGEEDEARLHHALAVRCEYEQHEQAMLAGTVGVDAWRREGESMVADARQALAWAQAAGLPVLALELARSIVARVQDPRHIEMASVVELCVSMYEADSGIDARLACRTWLAVDRFAFREPARWGAATQRALALARQLGSNDDDRFLLFAVLTEAARAAAGDLQLEQAQAWLDEARGIEQAHWPPVRRRVWARAAAFLAMAHGRPDQALQRLREVLELGLRAGDPSLATRLNIADMELLSGDAAAAVATGSALVTTLAGLRANELLALARINLAGAHLVLDQLGPARELLHAAWRAAPSFGPHWPHFENCLRLAALLAALEGRHEAAALLSGAAEARLAAEGSEPRGNEAAARERTERLLQAALGTVRLEQLCTQGAGLDPAQQTALALN